MMDSWNNYNNKGELGRGKFGIAYKAEHRVSNIIYAIKEIDCDQSAFKEIEILQQLNHPNIIKLYSCFCNNINNKLAIVMELANVGTLTNYRKRFIFESLYQFTFEVLQQISSGLLYLHLKKVMHHDLKPDNILVCSDFSGQMLYKIADFGVARVLSPDFQGKYYAINGIGDQNYMAPEILKGERYTVNADMWSLGSVLSFCLNGVDLFNNVNDILCHNSSIINLHQLGIDATTCFHRLLDPNYLVRPTFIEALNFVIFSLLEPNRHNRITAETLIQITTKMFDTLYQKNLLVKKWDLFDTNVQNLGTQCFAMAACVNPYNQILVDIVQQIKNMSSILKRNKFELFQTWKNMDFQFEILENHIRHSTLIDPYYLNQNNIPLSIITSMFQMRQIIKQELFRMASFSRRVDSISQVDIIRSELQSINIPVHV